MNGYELTTSVVIGTGCTSSCNFNYHTITPTTIPMQKPRPSKIPLNKYGFVCFIFGG